MSTDEIRTFDCTTQPVWLKDIPNFLVFENFYWAASGTNVQKSGRSSLRSCSSYVNYVSSFLLFFFSSFLLFFFSSFFPFKAFYMTCLNPQCYRGCLSIFTRCSSDILHLNCAIPLTSSKLYYPFLLRCVNSLLHTEAPAHTFLS